MHRTLFATILLLAATLTSVNAARPSVRKTARTTTRPSAIPAVVMPPQASPQDHAVAEAAERALGKTAGGVVALDPKTGRVITLINPHYSLFTAYQPCSVFKIVVAIAGLSEGVITPESTFTCSKGCWVWPGHGRIDLRRALAVSCNPYFQAVGERLGFEKIQHYAELLGLGSASGINLTGESSGRFPARVSPAGVPLLSSHAEGVATSAVQLAVLLSATVNGGVIYQPQVGAAEGFVPKERWRLPEGTRLDGLADGFLGAVNEGSATPAFDPEVAVAGKTGSCSHLGWFASYAPADHPEMVIVVFVRRGNGHLASAIAGRIYQDLFKPQPALPAASAAGGF